MQLQEIPGSFAICRLAPGAKVPARCFSATRTAEELSVVCLEAEVPPEAAKADRGWACIRVAGTLDFSLTGVLAALAQPLAAAGVSIFALSTFDTDYLLVRGRDLPAARAALEAAGHHFLT